jgi:hypothetical protein
MAPAASIPPPLSNRITGSFGSYALDDDAITGIASSSHLSDFEQDLVRKVCNFSGPYFTRM